MKLILLGQPRTGTHTLWKFLSSHKDITGSRVKETIYSGKWKYFPKNYLEWFDIKKYSKYLIDGSPNMYMHPNVIEKLHNIFYIKTIYHIRNPFDRIYSTIKQTIFTFACGGYSIFPSFIKCSYASEEEGRKHKDDLWSYGIISNWIKERLIIDRHKIIDFIPNLLDSDKISNASKYSDEIYLDRFDKLDMEKIFNFLDLESIKGFKGLDTLPQKNMQDIWYNLPPEINVKREVDLFWEENREKINQIILDDLKKIRHLIDIEDWINECKT